ncbi:MAG: argininosuccinate synthase [Planctomycetes bacterium]|nr:argininosuccinate synthase [Planctomycetota bacterium]
MKRIVLAYSGGLDTSFCLAWLREELGAEVLAVTADTGGFTPERSEEIAARAMALGAESHIWLDLKDQVFDDFVSYIVKGNLLKGGVYPLCVAAERTAQARSIAQLALERGANGLAHGSTAAGNDQVRFDVLFRAIAPGLEIHAPVRDLGWTREREAAYLAERGLALPPGTKEYSVNESLWGVTIGGKETHDPWTEPPEAVYQLTRPLARTPDLPREIVLGFEKGIPVAIDGERLPGPELVGRLNALAGEHGVGRGIHVGETVLGIKGRIAFEAPAPLVLIQAHRELEKLVLTKWQAYWSAQVGLFYAQHLHEGSYLDPVMRDLEAFLDSLQERVTGEVRLALHKGNARVAGVRSPHSLFGRGARYGEETALWDGRDAAGFGKIAGISSRIAAERDRTSDPEGG